jgi:Cytosol aminopeptidase family, N-terminal domain
MVHLDQSLDGLITRLRKNGNFQGHAYETQLITPPAGKIKAERLLLIGLGDRKLFTPELMKGLGAIAMREALRLNVPEYAFASDLKDAGIESPTSLVSENIVIGSIDAFRTVIYLQSIKMTTTNPFIKVTLLAGPAYFTIAGEGIKKAIAFYGHQ